MEYFCPFRLLDWCWACTACCHRYRVVLTQMYPPKSHSSMYGPPPTSQSRKRTADAIAIVTSYWGNYLWRKTHCWKYFYQRYEILNILCTRMPLAKLSAMGEKILQHTDQGTGLGIRNVMAVLSEPHSSDICRKWESAWRGIGEWRQEGGWCMKQGQSHR